MRCRCGLKLNDSNSHISWKKGWKERICNECGNRMIESMTLDEFIRNSPKVSKKDKQEYIEATSTFRWWNE